MSASDMLQPQQFMHASPYKMAKGTVMTRETNAAHGANFEISSGNTYFTSDRKIANNMGMAAMNGLARRTGAWHDPRGYRVYDVQPTGEYHEDQNDVRASYETPHPVSVLGRHVYNPPGTVRRASRRPPPMEEY